MTNRETRDVQLQNSRPKRVPLHEQKRNVLTISDKDPNYVYRIVNDTGDRINQFKLAGYEVVEHKAKVGEAEVADRNTSLGSGARTPVGAGTVGILMRIPRDIYDEDQRAKQREIDAKEKLLVRKAKKSTESDDGTYGGAELEVSTSKG
jgi:hypothetical protein